MASCNFSFNATTECEVDNNMYTIAFLPFKLISVMINLVLLCAAVYDRKKLQRQNYTYLCVISTLLSNFVYLLLSIWLTVDNYAQYRKDPETGSMSAAKYLWIFSEAFTVAMVFGICANVTSLIYVTLDSVYYVGRSGTEWGSSPRNDEKVSAHGKHKIAKVLVAVSWLVPVILTAFSFWGNCAKQCRCPSNNFIGEHCPINNTCSRMWAPLTKQFLMVIVAVWMLQIIVLAYCLARGIKRHNQALEDPGENTNGASDVTQGRQVKIVTTNNNGGSINGPPQKILRRKSTFQRKFNFRLKFAIIMTALIVVATTPGTVSLIIDAAMQCVPTTPLILTSGIFLYVYVTMSPIIMWKFLPSLRSAMQSFWIAVFACACLKSRSNRQRNSQTTSPSM